MLESAAMHRLITPILLLVTAAVVPAYGQQLDTKPNLSGIWVFNAQKSVLKMPAPSSLTLKIDSHDPRVQLSRTQFYGEQKNVWNLDIVADGQKEVVQSSPLYTSHIRMYWEGNSLVLDEKITAGDGTKATNVVSYSLADGGNSLQAVERVESPSGKFTNKWVYDKQAQ
jgi:hypothetical protein